MSSQNRKTGHVDDGDGHRVLAVVGPARHPNCSNRISAGKHDDHRGQQGDRHVVSVAIELHYPVQPCVSIAVTDRTRLSFGTKGAALLRRLTLVLFGIALLSSFSFGQARREVLLSESE